MKLTRKKEILKVINSEIKKAQITCQKTDKTAKIFKRASRSQQGDRLYFEDAAHLAQERLEQLQALKKEVVVASTQSAPTVKQASFVSIEYDNGDTDSFYFVSQGTTLAGIQLITHQSPLGQSIKGKKKKEKFSYQVKREMELTTFSGVINKI